MRAAIALHARCDRAACHLQPAAGGGAAALGEAGVGGDDDGVGEAGHCARDQVVRGAHGPGEAHREAQLREVPGWRCGRGQAQG